jgi:LPS-assembly protein
MRAAQAPYETYGRQSAPARLSKSTVGRWGALVRVCTSLTCLVAVVVSVAATQMISSSAATAQDPTRNRAAATPSAFPKPKDGFFGTKPELDRSLPLYLQGDELIYDTDGNRVIARGNVEIFYNNNILTADEVVYDQSANTLSANGDVTLREANGNIIRAERYTLTEDFRDGFVESLSITARDDSRLTAEQAIRRGGNVSELRNASFTACKEKEGVPPLWCIKAKKVIHDQNAATLTYQDATFEIFGAPVLYLPYFQHADPSVKRKSGFLIPEYMSSDDLGFGVSTPYYFALAPNYDVLLHPMYTTKQGILYRLDWRHRISRDGQYTVKIQGIDQDGGDLPDGLEFDRRQDLDGWRGSVETKGRIGLGSWWNLGWDVTLESDDTFRRFYKLDDIRRTDRVNKVYLEGISNRNYFGLNLYHFGGLLLTDTGDSESYVHPMLDYNYVFSDPIFGGELSWNTNAVSFTRNDQRFVEDLFTPYVTENQSVQRASTEIKWRRRLTDQIGITYTPFAELRADVYSYENYVNPFDRTIIEDDTVGRGLAAGGITVTYPWIAHSNVGSHTVEPIGQVVSRATTDEDQSLLPVEDSRSLYFDDSNLFETNKFSGWDHYETGTRANVGVQYTFQANNGGYARVLVGQSFHLGGNNPYDNPGFSQHPNPFSTRDPANSTYRFSRASGLQTDQSDYVVGLYFAPINNFRLISQSRFDEDALDLRTEQLKANLNYGPLAASIGYAYTNLDQEFRTSVNSEQEVTGNIGLQLTNNWGVFGGMRYDIDESEIRTTAIGLRYGDECFALEASYRKSGIDDPARDLEPDETIMFRFELKHLGAYRYKTDILDTEPDDQQLN